MKPIEEHGLDASPSWEISGQRDAGSLQEDASSGDNAETQREDDGVGNPTQVRICPSDMVLAGEACIDIFEAPNKIGALPLAMQTAHDGEAWCGQQGKRLCTEAEWVRACQGSRRFKYPYGDRWVAGRCNDDKIWRAPDWTALASWPSEEAKNEATWLYQADASGLRGECMSEEGALDMTGNVAEWVVRTQSSATNYEHALKGCYWSKCYGGANPNCNFANSAHPGTFRSYETGFRCCRFPLVPLAKLRTGD